MEPEQLRVVESGAVINEQDIRIHFNIRIAIGKPIGVLPMRGGTSPVKEARGCEHKRSRAYRENAGASLVRAAESANEMIRHRGSFSGVRAVSSEGS